MRVIGPMELIFVLVIALLILGPKRLPAAGRSLGRGLREFKDGISGRDDAAERIEASAQTVPDAAIAQNTTTSASTSETRTQHPAIP
jgi:sec-independent protein translocase protein TatA